MAQRLGREEEVHTQLARASRMEGKMKPIEEMTELELREAVAVEIMGWTRDEDGWDDHGRLIVDEPLFESSIEAAFEVVEKTRDIQNRWGGANRVLLEQKPDGTFKAAFYGATTNWEAWAWCDATTAARAICIAALKAVRAK